MTAGRAQGGGYGCSVWLAGGFEPPDPYSCG
jgi:hypothetical protein